MAKTRVLIGIRSRRRREGVRQLLNEQSDLEVVGEAGDVGRRWTWPEDLQT